MSSKQDAIARKSNGMTESEWVRAVPTGPLWRRILTAIYNPKEKSFLGRTAKRWGIVLTFYVVFYAVLALMFALCMGGLLATLDMARPKWTLDRSLIGVNPGVTARPRPADGVVLRYDRSNATNYETYTQQLSEFMQPYESAGWSDDGTACSANDSYGFPDAPCIFVKLNKIFDWEPDFFDDEASLPADMPADLVQHIADTDPSDRKQVWVSCTEESGNSTRVEYPRGRGLPRRFYPFRNEPGYVSPLVVVKLVSPMNSLAIVRCRAWAKNIIYNKSIKEATGYARIQLYIEDKTSQHAADAALGSE